MKATCAWVERFGEIVRGMDALAHVAVWDRLFSRRCPRSGGIAGADGLPPPLPRGERPQIMAAIGGIDIALWDIKGEHAGSRSGGCREASRGRFRPTGREVTTGSPADEARRVRTVREAIGKDISLMLDMNAPYDVDGLSGR